MTAALTDRQEAELAFRQLTKEQLKSFDARISREFQHMIDRAKFAAGIAARNGNESTDDLVAWTPPGEQFAEGTNVAAALLGEAIIHLVASKMLMSSGMAGEKIAYVERLAELISEELTKD